jgi:hypothetical protein
MIIEAILKTIFKINKSTFEIIISEIQYLL